MGTLGNSTANITHADNAQRLACQIRGQTKGLALAPGTAFYMPMSPHNLAGTVDKQAIGQIGHSIHQNTRRVAHRNAPGSAGRNINIVITHAGLSNNLQLGCLGQKLFVNANIARGKQRFRLSKPLIKLLLGHTTTLLPAQ